MADPISACEADPKLASDTFQPSFVVVQARTAEVLKSSASLFRVYAEWLGIDLSFQNFEAEVASLPGKYAPETGGELLLAYLTDHEGSILEGKEPIGCIACRDITGVVDAFNATAGVPTASTSGKRIGEFKRLYVKPAGRGLGIGAALVKRLMDVARKVPYDEVLLDTLPHMHAAIKLYKKNGFTETEKYYDTVLTDSIFMRCILDEENA